MVTSLGFSHFDEQAASVRALGPGRRLDYPQPVSPRTQPTDGTAQWAMRGEIGTW